MANQPTIYKREAFIEKCKKEKLYLQLRLAAQLRKDIDRLVADWSNEVGNEALLQFLTNASKSSVDCDNSISSQCCQKQQETDKTSSKHKETSAHFGEIDSQGDLSQYDREETACDINESKTSKCNETSEKVQNGTTSHEEITSENDSTDIASNVNYDAQPSNSSYNITLSNLEESDLKNISPQEDNSQDISDSKIKNSICNDKNISSSHERPCESNSDETANGESTIFTEAVSVLGAELLYLYQRGIHVDTTLVAEGQRFYAHRCILACRSQYFAAMLGGGWVESASKEVNMEGISSDVLEKVLLYIYGGFIEDCYLPVVAISDMLGIAGLSDCMTHALKRDKCHFFHKPCNECLIGVIETLPVAYSYGLEDLYQRCLKWNGLYFDRLWKIKSFTQLPAEIMGKCLDSVTLDINILNVITTYTNATKLLTALKNLKGREPVVDLSEKLMEHCIRFISKDVMVVICRKKDALESAYEGMGAEDISSLLGAAMKLQSPQVGMSTYVGLDEICRKVEVWQEQRDTPQLYHERFYFDMRAHAKQYLTSNIYLVMSLPEWGMKLDKAQQQTIKKEAGYVSVGTDNLPRFPKPKLSDKQGFKFKPKQGKLATPPKSSIGKNSRATSFASTSNAAAMFGARPKTTVLNGGMKQNTLPQIKVTSNASNVQKNKAPVNTSRASRTKYHSGGSYIDTRNSANAAGINETFHGFTSRTKQISKSNTNMNSDATTSKNLSVKLQKNNLNRSLNNLVDINYNSIGKTNNRGLGSSKSSLFNGKESNVCSLYLKLDGYPVCKSNGIPCSIADDQDALEFSVRFENELLFNFVRPADF